jgi:hypothetical protein
MIYFETDQPHFVVWPYLAVGIDDELWIGVGWLNFEIGWRNGDGGLGDDTNHGIKENT